MPIGREAEVYDGIIAYLNTLNSPADICSSILMFYEAINQPLSVHTSPRSYDYPLANPYSRPDDSVSQSVIDTLSYLQSPEVSK